MTNLLSNPGFEGLTRPGGYTHDTHTGEVHGNFVTPEGWVGWWDEREGRRRPETKVIQVVPPFIGPPCRIHEGDWAVQMFVAFHAWMGGYYQVVHDLVVGTDYEAGFYAHAWCNHQSLPHDGDPNCAPMGCGPLYYAEDELPPLDGDPLHDARWAALFQVGVQYVGEGWKPDPTYAVIWGPAAAIYNAYASVPPLRFRAEAEDVAVFIRGAFRWDYRNNDGYYDSAYLKPAEAPPERPYERTYILLPPDVIRDEAHSVLDAHFDKRQTVGFSADDAGVDADNLMRRAVIAYRPEAWPGDLEGFFETYYPGIDEYEARELPLSPPPTIDLTPRATLHLQTLIPGIKAFLQAVQPGCIKRVTGMEDLVTMKRWSPTTTSVYRHHVEGENQDVYLNDPDGDRAGARWIAHFSDSLRAVCATGLWTPEDPLYVEAWNELGWAAGNLERIAKAVNIERGFVRQLTALGLPVAPVTFCAGVGNIGRPGREEEDFLLLVDLARETQMAGGAFGLHSYWTPGRLIENWRILAGRYQWIDEILVANGVHVRWMLGECGCAGRLDHWEPLEGGGWRDINAYNGDWPRYEADIIEFDRRLREWNATHGFRLLGAPLFTTGIGIGWWAFLLETPQINALAASLS